MRQVVVFSAFVGFLLSAGPATAASELSHANDPRMRRHVKATEEYEAFAVDLQGKLNRGEITNKEARALTRARFGDSRKQHFIRGGGPQIEIQNVPTNTWPLKQQQ